jgi:hypothetical protein
MRDGEIGSREEGSVKEVSHKSFADDGNHMTGHAPSSLCKFKFKLHDHEL